MRDIKQLTETLYRIDGRGYKAYKDIQGSYAFRGGSLHVDHVQGDPFAAPSKARVRLDQSTAGLPTDLIEPRVRRIALGDWLTRRAHRAIGEVGKKGGGSGKSGLVTIDAGGQEVLERSSVAVTPDWVEARVEVGLPAAGRRVLGQQAAAVLCEQLPEVAHEALVWSDAVDWEGRRFIECVENQEHIRGQLADRALVAFLADDAILPRRSGVSDEPMERERAVALKSPDVLRVQFDLPNPVEGPGGSTTSISGIGVPAGVTLIAGGGYHGKSTVLRTIERCVYPHVPGDGREYVVTRPDAVKVRAEDRRRIEQVAIAPFIDRLPDGSDTTAFSTDEASGSTSQAAAVVEAVEAGAEALLMDEDTCASNLMVRDARMQALVEKSHEPITPFLDRVRELYERMGVSSILVMGGSGDYFDVADTVVMMRHYVPYDTTEEARRIAREYPTHRKAEADSGPSVQRTDRAPVAGSVDPSRGKKAVKIDAATYQTLRFGEQTIDLRAVDQLLDISQTRAIGQAIHLAAERCMGRDVALRDVLAEVDRILDERGLAALGPSRGGPDNQPHPGRLARPRRHEIAAALNRLRSVRMRSLAPQGVAAK